ncbi:MAG: hypothetical protein ACI9Y1_002967 [Lentisphaeria bacterium]|jgi:hypothetical protein
MRKYWRYAIYFGGNYVEFFVSARTKCSYGRPLRPKFGRPIFQIGYILGYLALRYIRAKSMQNTDNNDHVGDTSPSRCTVEKTTQINRKTKPVVSDNSAVTVINVLQPVGQHPQPLEIEIKPGSVIGGRFAIEDILGRGGMGSVYRALDLHKPRASKAPQSSSTEKTSKHYVAIKLLNDAFKSHPQALTTLQREAKRTQALAHPNIVKVLAFTQTKNDIYFTMEQLIGSDLNKILKLQCGFTIDEENRLNIIEQIATGLGFAHSKGIVHSDLKPANLFLTKEGVVKILDFGIARAANKELYQDGFDPGQLGALTLMYASPEMIRSQAAHPSDDVYALGIIACELLGGSHPFSGKDALSASKACLKPKLPNISNLMIADCIRQTLCFERDKRISDANKFLSLFRAAISNSAV